MTPDEVSAALSHGSLELSESLDEGANAAFAGVVSMAGVELRCVYKPRRGERPLWDFPTGNLAGREVATFLVDQAAGLRVAPPTVLRAGPFGVGSVQLWVENSEAHAAELVDVRSAVDTPASWRVVVRGEDQRGRPVVLAHADDDRLRRLALLDAVVNNADRKASHIFVDSSGALFGIDHGLTFNVDPKLRTVLWGFVDDQLSEETRATLEALAKQLANGLAKQLAEHLTVDEIRACQQRISKILAADHLPAPSSQWPALPWPLY